jgi:hypothetical protein
LSEIARRWVTDRTETSRPIELGGSFIFSSIIAAVS